MKFDKTILEEAHKHSSKHRKEILKSKLCGCFYCETIFNLSEIKEWIDEGKNNIGQTALCPKCGIDSVIGLQSGFPINDKKFLKEMHKYWFNRIVSFKKLEEIHNQLLANIKAKLPELEELLEKISSHWGYEEPIYRFYYQSFKVYHLQNITKEIVKTLRSIAPEGQNLCKEFREIIKAGASGKKFELKHNKNWTYHTRVFVEAFFHAKFFLEMAVKYGKELKKAPRMLPYGWAALLCLYNLR